MEGRLIEAAKRGDFDRVNALLNRGVNVNHQTPKKQWTALMWAAYKGYRDIVAQLLGRGADPDLQNKEGGTALMIAIQSGYIKIVKELLARGANLNLQDNHGVSALILAAHHGRLEMVKELLDRGVDPNIQYKNGWTALMFVVENNKLLEIAEELLNRGADPYLQNTRGQMAIDLARPLVNPNMAKLFAKFAVAPVITNPTTGISNLMILAANGPMAQLRAVIDLNPALDLNHQDQDGNTALIYAINNRQKENVALLLDRGANPNLANNGGGTPLAYAIELNDPEIEQILIEAGAQ